MKISMKRLKAEDVREELAKLAHEQWSNWMKYLFDKSKKESDGTVTIPKWAVDRWERQVNTEYSELSESEKESDRNEANKFMEVMNKGKQADG